jgi:ABC-type molybdenum transport system ATPase subunit/photorepair protein PhrA
MLQRAFRIRRVSHIRTYATARREHGRPPLVRIDNATFHRQQPSSQLTDEEAVTNQALFPGLTYEVPTDNDGQYWAVVGPSNAGKTTFLEILRGQYLCNPPSSRRYPYLSTDELRAKDPRLRDPRRAIQYSGFDNKPGGLSGVGTYLSARYESRREVTDFSLQDFLLGNTQLNAAERTDGLDMELLESIAHDLRLHDLMKMPVSNLSNGQTRRARIAKALLGKPELLLLDEPFMGLDPPTTVSLSPLLRRLAEKSTPRILLSLRPQDPIPDWITHILFLKELNVEYRGTVEEVSHKLMAAATALSELPKDAEQPTQWPANHSEFGRRLTQFGPMPNALKQNDPAMREAQEKLNAGDTDGLTIRTAKVGEWAARQIAGFGAWAYQQHILSHTPPEIGEPVIEMDGVTVKYGDKTVLGGWRQEGQDKDGLVWTVKRGERWGIFGPNGMSIRLRKVGSLL